MCQFHNDKYIRLALVMENQGPLAMRYDMGEGGVVLVSTARMIQTLSVLCSLVLFAFSDGLRHGMDLGHTEDGWKRLVAWSTSML